MSAEYYTLEKAAEVLGLPTAEVNRLREKSLLRAFRDGSSWKFRKVDIDDYLAGLIKGRSKDKSVSESDFDITGSNDDNLDSAEFDSIMEDGLLLDEDLVDTSASTRKGGVSVELTDDDFLLDDGLSLSGDDEVLEVAPAALVDEKSDVDLAIDDDALVLDGGSSAQLNIAGDSGLSLIDIVDEDLELQEADAGGSDAMLEIDEDDDILSLIGDDVQPDFTSSTSIPTEEDFLLKPAANKAEGEDSDSESASQVIALDEETGGMGFSGAGSGFGGGFGAAEPDFAAAGGGFATPESPFGTAAPGATGGFDAGDPFGGPTGAGGYSASGAMPTSPASSEANYTPLLVTSLVCATVLLILPGIMLVDLIIHMWSWKEPFAVNSSLMDMLCGMAGLK